MMNKFPMIEHPSKTDKLKQNCPYLCNATAEVTYIRDVQDC